MNPKGAAFNSTTTPTLGMGFEMAPNLVGTVQKFVDKYSDKNTNNVNKPTNSKTPATKTPVTWQTMNQAVSNQQKEELNKLLAKFNLTPNEPNAPPPSPEPEIFGPPVPVENPDEVDPDFLPEYQTPYQEFDKWWDYKRGMEEMWQRMWEEQYGKNREKAMNEQFEAMREHLRREYERMRRDRGNGQAPSWKVFQEILRQFNEYFNPPIYA
jgi:hypothetical protein